MEQCCSYFLERKTQEEIDKLVNYLKTSRRSFIHVQDRPNWHVDLHPRRVDQTLKKRTP